MVQRQGSSLCGYCGKEWSGYDKFGHRRPYCSNECAHNSQRVVNEILEVFEDGTCTVAIKGGTMLCDKQDIERWQALKHGGLYVHSRGYVYGKVGKGNRKFHRFVLPVEMVDHINHDKLDNRRCNLRESDPRKNQANQVLARHNTSGYKGVTHRQGCWIAQLCYRDVSGNKKTHAIYCSSKEEAAITYDKMVVARYGEHAATNRSLGLLS